MKERYQILFLDRKGGKISLRYWEPRRVVLQDTDYLEMGMWMDRTDFSVYHIHNMASG